MAYEHKDNSGSLFKNDRKERDTHPDWNGTLVVEGKQYWLSGWTKEKNGSTYFSLALKPKQPSTRQSAPERAETYTTRVMKPAPTASPQDVGDDIPF